MKTKLNGEMTLTFVMGGISKKTKKPYLQVSDGVEAKFISIPKDMEVNEETFAEYERGDEITVDVLIDPFGGRMTLNTI